MNITLLAAKFRARAKAQGLRSTVRQAFWKVTHRSENSKVDDFDLQYGTNTAGTVNLWKYRIASPNAEHGVAYGCTSARHIEVLLDPLPRGITFLDLGCGKGRPLIVASRMGFERVIGVEFVRELAEIAEANLRITSSAGSVVCTDAAYYEFPEGPLVVYMYNPFDVKIMTHVSTNLKRHRGELWVVYVNPLHAELFDAWLQPHDLDVSQRKLFSRGSVAIWSNE